VIGPLRTAFELGLRCSRVPLDLVLQVSGRTDSIHELRLDRAEAGVRSAVGAVLGDEELREQGQRGLAVAREREEAARARHERDDADGWTT
jgi:hypothetical protein